MNEVEVYLGVKKGRIFGVDEEVDDIGTTLLVTRFPHVDVVETDFGGDKKVFLKPWRFEFTPPF